jgi:hypothetical protein
MALAKPPAYRLSCDEIWLVLNGLPRISGTFDMDALRGVRVVSQFDHVVFLDVLSGTHVMLAG